MKKYSLENIVCILACVFPFVGWLTSWGFHPLMPRSEP